MQVQSEASLIVFDGSYTQKNGHRIAVLFILHNNVLISYFIPHLSLFWVPMRWAKKHLFEVILLYLAVFYI